MEQKFTIMVIAFLLQPVLLGTNAVAIPRTSVRIAGTGAWFPILLDTIAAILISYTYIYLGLKYRDKTIYEYSELLVGKFVSKIIIIPYILIFFLGAVQFLNYLAYSTKYYYLIRTPIWFIMLSIILAVLYLTIKGFKTIYKVTIIYVIIAYLIIAVVTLLGIDKTFNILNLYPFLDSGDFKKYLMTCLYISNNFFGIQILSVLPLSKDIDMKKIFKYITISILTVGMSFTIFTEWSLAMMGKSGILRYIEPIIAFTRSKEVGFSDSKGRIEIFLFIGHVMLNICAISINMYASSTLLKKMIYKLPIKIILILIAILVFIASLIPKDRDQANIIITFQNYIGLFTVLIIPMILVTISKFKKVNL